MLRLDDRWLWDFWFAQDGADYHVFYLQAPRSLGDADARHWNATIGHAVSRDLRRWAVLPDALRAGEPGDFDDQSTWTGSVLRAEGAWHLFYTGVSTRDGGRVQRIGAAVSDDLFVWRKRGPLLAADPRWYEKLAPGSGWHEEAWRDPWVFWHAPTGDYRMFLTARAHVGPPDGRGVIGHARSADLRDWEVLPPLTEPGEYGHLEVPQLVEIDGRCYLLFSVYDWAPLRAAPPARHGDVRHPLPRGRPAPRPVPLPRRRFPRRRPRGLPLRRQDPPGPRRRLGLPALLPVPRRRRVPRPPQRPRPHHRHARRPPLNRLSPSARAGGLGARRR